MLKTKRCYHCKKTFPIENFWKDSRVKSGIRAGCKQCCGTQYSNWQKNNPEKVKGYNRKGYARLKGTIGYKFWRIKATSKQRGLEFRIEEKDFIELMSKECFYCGSKLHIGLDRVDSNYGYLLENVVPCCYRCNVAKNTMTQEEFIDLCSAIIKKHGDKNLLFTKTLGTKDA